MASLVTEEVSEFFHRLTEKYRGEINNGSCFRYSASIFVWFYLIPISKPDWNFAVVSQDVFNGSLGPVHHPVGYSLRQTRLRLGLLLDPEVEHDWLDGDALDEDSPVDHGQGGGHEHLGVRGKLLLDEQDQSKGHPASEATVHHDELLRPVEFLDPVSVGNEG